MKRISYPKVRKDGSKVSNVLTSKKGVEFRAIIHLEEGWYKIIRMANGSVELQGTCTNKNYLRRVVKKRLVELGVEFGHELKKSGHFSKFMKQLVDTGRNRPKKEWE